MKLAISLLAMAISFGPAASQSAELVEAWQSVRALGMGNAYTAVVDDADALFFNPAGLANASGFDWTLFDVHGGLGNPDSLTELEKIISPDSETFYEDLKALYGERFWIGAGAKTAITLPGFGMAYFGSANAGVYVENPAYTTMNLNYFLDTGVALGFAFDLVPDFVQLGLAGKRLTRIGTTVPVGPSILATMETEALEEELKRQGVGYGFDLGVLFSAPGPLSPALSFVYKNIGSVSFSHVAGAGPPPSIPAEMTIGASMRLDAGLVTITPSLDYKHADNPDIQLAQKLHIGVEVDLPLIDIRAGLSQGYYTAGAGLNFGILRADIATYGVELGEYPGQLEDRRYLAQVTLELGFDPVEFGFGTDGRSGHRRRLKQRR